MWPEMRSMVARVTASSKAHSTTYLCTRVLIQILCIPPYSLIFFPLFLFLPHFKSPTHSAQNGHNFSHELWQSHKGMPSLASLFRVSGEHHRPPKRGCKAVSSRYLPTYASPHHFSHTSSGNPRREQRHMEDANEKVLSLPFQGQFLRSGK